MTKCSDPIFTIISVITVVTSRSTMNNPSLLSLLLVFLLAVSLPPAAADVAMRLVSVSVGTTSSHVECLHGIVYAANSTFEANRRRVAGLLQAEAAARGPYYTKRAVGYWPFRAEASFFCRRRGVDGTGFCAACLAGALLELERECPYHKEASFYGRNCTLELGEYRVFGTAVVYEGNILKQAMASGLIFQAIGFAWLFFLLLQEWRSRKRGTMMHSTSLLSGD
ncbi:hypothetical protein SEVIR_2G351600v4 [Setaria viridis]|uniref:Gnk2-homologous domain-containing protein n=2 Tax=Setaria viridis TaxID=4556 RepID=A0A4U6VZV1_SETVI|nr:cysteine-rich receptor-like protein kinase 4 [Setaria viridis]TKW35132.1 hypothetical protein SEVIR_2G351600v2 [Setaria viridis]